MDPQAAKYLGAGLAALGMGIGTYLGETGIAREVVTGHDYRAYSSAIKTALITGDFMHHPCQIAHPEWAAAVDYDSARSTQTRREVFERYADTPTLIIGTQFSSPTAGRLVRDGATYRLDV